MNQKGGEERGRRRGGEGEERGRRGGDINKVSAE